MSVQPGSVLTLKGDAYSRGVSYGAQARGLISKGIKHYVEIWEKTGKTRAELLDVIRGFSPLIEDYDGEILREMEGIASGARLPLEEVLLLNARYELMSVAFFAADGDSAMGRAECTSLAATRGATTDDHTYVAQNWDLTVEARQRCVLLEVVQDDRPNIVAHVEAGLVAHKGMNSAGLGIAINSLGSQLDDFAPCVPVFVLARAVLESGTLDEAIQAIDRARRSASVNFTVGSDAGEVASLEITPVDVSRLDGTNDRTAHANVFRDLREGRGIKDELARRYPVFSERSVRAQELIARSDVSFDSLISIFKDRANKPESICRHVDDQPPEAAEALRLETVVSMVMDLTERSIFLADGPPDRYEYKRHIFPSLARR